MLYTFAKGLNGLTGEVRGAEVRGAEVRDCGGGARRPLARSTHHLPHDLSDRPGRSLRARHRRHGRCVRPHGEAPFDRFRGNLEEVPAKVRTRVLATVTALTQALAREHEVRVGCVVLAVHVGTVTRRVPEQHHVVTTHDPGDAACTAATGVRLRDRRLDGRLDRWDNVLEVAKARVRQVRPGIRGRVPVGRLSVGRVAQSRRGDRGPQCHAFEEPPDRRHALLDGHVVNGRRRAVSGPLAHRDIRAGLLLLGAPRQPHARALVHRFVHDVMEGVHEWVFDIRQRGQHALADVSRARGRGKDAVKGHVEPYLCFAGLERLRGVGHAQHRRAHRRGVEAVDRRPDERADEMCYGPWHVAARQLFRHLGGRVGVQVVKHAENRRADLDDARCGPATDHPLGVLVYEFKRRGVGDAQHSAVEQEVRRGFAAPPADESPRLGPGVHVTLHRKQFKHTREWGAINE